MKLKFLDSLSIYEGETKNNLLDGFGTLKTSKGKYYEGNFKNSKFHGEGVYFNINNNFNKNHLAIEFTEKKDPRCDYTEGQDKIIIGKFKSNIIDGACHVLSSSGVSHLNFKNGYLNGRSVIILADANANLVIQWFKNGILNSNDSMWDTEELNLNPSNEVDLVTAKKVYRVRFLELAKKYNWLPKQYSDIKSYQNMLNKWVSKNNYIKL